MEPGLRGANGDPRAANNALETINAAATAIASADSRVPQATARKKRWWNRWSIYWCFRSHNHRKKRIGNAALVAEPVAPDNTITQPPRYPAQPSVIALPFVAPPSSPASFFQSEPASATQSPAGIVSLNPVPTSMYSPSGPANIFAIGPYAHETHLVSPPVFSTFSTEPSTASFTPPPESVHLTTPSSPEVPFAKLLNPNLHYGEMRPRYQMSPCEFQFYQLPPGSPIGQLISPSSGFSGSGTTSPLPDGDTATGSPSFPPFPMSEPPVLKLYKVSSCGRASCHGSGTLTPETVRSSPQNGQISRPAPAPYLDVGCPNSQITGDHRVWFDTNVEDVVRCVEKKCKTPLEDRTASLKIEPTGETSNRMILKDSDEGKEAPKHREHQPDSLGSISEFKFESDNPATKTCRLTNEKVVREEDSVANDWSFLHVMQPNIS